MSNFKVLLTTYSTAFARSGGGEVEMLQVQDALKSVGVDADIYGVSSRPIDYYDYAIHFSVHGDGTAILNEIKLAQKKLYLWPNIWWNTEPESSEITRIQELINSAEKVIFKSNAEIKNVEKYILIPQEKIYIIPYSYSTAFRDKVDVEFSKALVGQEEYFLSVGLIEPVKNQLPLIKAINSMKKKAVFIGGYRDKNYYSQCASIAGPNIKFLPFLKANSLLLRSIFANALAVVEISNDPPGRSVIEASIMKKPVVMKEGAWQLEYFSENAWYAKSDSEEHLSAALKMAEDSDGSKENQNYLSFYERYSSLQFGRALLNCLIK